MSFKKTLITTSIIASAVSFAATAHDHGNHENKSTWLGVFAGKYQGDSMRPNEQQLYDGGKMAGAELGFRFTPEWAFRLEATRTFIDTEMNSEIDGVNFGIDAMYFWDQSNKYVFLGARSLDDSIESTLSGAAGIGAQWGGASDFRLITEAGYYRDFEHDYNDFVLKIGLSYHFGETVRGSGKSKVAETNNDTDNDGVLNMSDNCPNTPAGTPVDLRGCALKDDDGDGVLNAQDMCPTTAKGVTVDATGCAEVKMVERTVRLNALFDNNSAIVKNPNSPEFVKFATFMNQNPNAQAVVEGHTSVVGSAEHNQSLSERRAKNIREVLVDLHGAPADRIDTIGYGESRPLNDAMTASAHAENRRVVAVVTAIVKE